MNDTAEAPPAFVLGMDIEEVYIVFGEALQLSLGGLAPQHYDLIQEKARRVRGAMLRFGCRDQLVELFEALMATVRRAGDPEVPGAEENNMLAQTLSTLMRAVWGYLGAEDAALYDLGIMLTRLHLCVRVLYPDDGGGPPGGLRGVYITELQRVVPQVRDFLAAADRDVGDAAPKQLSARLRSLAGEIDRWDGGTEQWCRAARQRVDRVFAAVGVLPRTPPVASGAPPVASAAPAGGRPRADDRRILALQQAKERAGQLFAARDYPAAEETRRALIEECRGALGFTHPFTLAVRADLAATLMMMKRGALAADVALDLADDAEETLGPRDPGTVRLQIHALFVLMATRPPGEEGLEFFRSRLGWLYDAEPETLDPPFAELQRELFGVVRG